MQMFLVREAALHCSLRARNTEQKENNFCQNRDMKSNAFPVSFWVRVGNGRNGQWSSPKKTNNRLIDRQAQINRNNRQGPINRNNRWSLKDGLFPLWFTLITPVEFFPRRDTKARPKMLHCRLKPSWQLLTFSFWLFGWDRRKGKHAGNIQPNAHEVSSVGHVGKKNHAPHYLA